MLEARAGQTVSDRTDFVGRADCGNATRIGNAGEVSTLTQLATGVYAWVAGGGAGAPNAGVIVDDDGLTVVDTLLSPAQAVEFATACAALDRPVRRVVLTSSHIAHVGGTSAFPLPAIYGSEQISAHLDQPPNVAACQALYPAHAAELTGIETRAVTHLVTEAAWLTPSAVAAPLHAQAAQNLIVQVPDARVVFAGAVATFASTPLMHDADPTAWLASLDQILEWGTTIVPGHGPVGGEAEVRTLQGYLRACVDADGDPDAIAPGPWDSWPDRHYDTVNVERAALLQDGDHSPPPSFLRLLGIR